MCQIKKSYSGFRNKWVVNYHSNLTSSSSYADTHCMWNILCIRQSYDEKMANPHFCDKYRFC